MTAVDATPVRAKRRPYRREQILEEAIRLFAENGFHATGMGDIGAAVGISGPGIYRHFRSKDEILTVAINLAADEMLEAVQRIVDDSDSALETMQRLVVHSIDVLLTSPDLILTAIREWRNVDEQSRAVLNRARRLRIEEWALPLGQLRPDLSTTEARFLAATTQRMLLAGAEYIGEIDTERLRQTLYDMSMAVLVPDT